MRVIVRTALAAAVALVAAGTLPAVPARADDTTPPTLTGLTAVPDTVDVTLAGATVHFTATVTDDQAGCSYVYVSLASPLGGQYNGTYLYLTGGTPTNGVFEGDAAFPRFSDPGDWPLWIGVNDAVNNSHDYSPGDLALLGLPAAVHVISVPDDEAPVLTSLTASADTVDVTAGPATIHFTATVTDDLSGCGYVYVSLASPVGGQYANAYLYLTSGTTNDGVYEGDVTIPRFSDPGAWPLYASVVDAVNNGRNYAPEDLVPLGAPAALEVISTPDEEAPVLTGLTVVPDRVDVTEGPAIVHIRATVTDDLSGCNYLYASLTSPLGGQYVNNYLYLTGGTPNEGVFEGDLVFPRYSDTGAWPIYLGLADMANNSRDYAPADLATAGLPSVVHVNPFQVISIRDVLNDQGRRVRVRWHAIAHDAAGSDTVITAYSVWRRVDAYRKAGGAIPDSDGRAVAYPPGDWDYVKSVPAHGEETYGTICETLADSTIAAGQSWTVFFVRAETASPTLFFDTVPDSGYSVDNLAPSVPAALAVARDPAAGNVLTWQPSPDVDFRYFRIYRAGPGDLAFEPWTLVHETTANGWTDPAGTGSGAYAYRVTALDFAGNESGGAIRAVTAVPGDAPAPTLRLHQNVPNPFNPTTTLRFELPAARHARLAVYDAAGRRLRTLLDADLPAGPHEQRWDGRDESGRPLPSGGFFVRLDAGGESRVIRVSLLR